MTCIVCEALLIDFKIIIDKFKILLIICLENPKELHLSITELSMMLLPMLISILEADLL